MSPALDPGKDARAAGGIPIVGVFDGYRAVAIFLHRPLPHLPFLRGRRGGRRLGGRGRDLRHPAAACRSRSCSSSAASSSSSPPPPGRRFGDVGDYALRRAARILPAYWLSLAVAILLLAILPLAPGIPGVGEVILHVTMLQTPAPLFDGDFALGFGIVASVWTLSVETVFYVLLPVVAGAYFRRPLVGLAIAAALLVVWRLVALHVDSIFGVGAATQERWDVFYASQFPSWGLSFAAGMTGAWAYVRLRERVAPERLARGAQVVAACAAAATVVIVIFAGREAVHDPNLLAGLFARQSLAVSLTLPLALATAMVALALAPARAQLPFANRPLRSLGDISYGVYLIHLAVIAVIVAEFSLPRDGSVSAVLQWIAIVIPVSLAYAYFSAVLLERPLRRWARRVRPSRRGRGRRRRPARGLDRDPHLQPPRMARPERSTACSTRTTPTSRRWWSTTAPPTGPRSCSPTTRGAGPSTGSGTCASPTRARPTRSTTATGAARGEILGYLSDDDVLLPGAVRRLAAELIEHPDAAAVYPGYREIDAQGRVEDTVRPIEYSPRTALRLHDTVIGPGGLARRRALERAGGWDPELRWMGDLIMWMGVGLAGPVIRVAGAARLLAPASRVGDPAAVGRACPRAPAGGGDRGGPQWHAHAEHRRARRGDPQRLLLRRLLRRHRRHLAGRAIRRLRPPSEAALGDDVEARARRRDRLGRGRSQRGCVPRAGRGDRPRRRPP